MLLVHCFSREKVLLIALNWYSDVPSTVRTNTKSVEAHRPHTPICFAMRDVNACMQSTMSNLILADINLAVGWSIRQSAKFNSMPNFQAIWCIATTLVWDSEHTLLIVVHFIQPILKSIKECHAFYFWLICGVVKCCSIEVSFFGKICHQLFDLHGIIYCILYRIYIEVGNQSPPPPPWVNNTSIVGFYIEVGNPLPRVNNSSITFPPPTKKSCMKPCKQILGHKTSFQFQYTYELHAFYLLMQCTFCMYRSQGYQVHCA